MLTRRSRAREVALQLLFQRDINPGLPRKVIERFARDRLRDRSMIPFALSLYDGVIAQQAAVDEKLSATAENWKLHRMAAVDRNVLRLAAYELIHTPDTPLKVILNEAIELSRRFGSAESSAFVNGILDKIAHAARPEVVVAQ